jgi:hypothetical protein
MLVQHALALLSQRRHHGKHVAGSFVKKIYCISSAV